jgi:hypothetical protein
VTNACGCVSLFDTIEFEVSESPALTIDCPTVVCENDNVEYSINGYEECGKFQWEVQGGTIIDQFDNVINVDWDRPNATIDGFGIISFNQANCEGVCNGWITERVPVILDNGDEVLEGADQVCLGEQQLFSMPQWPTTRFDWSLSTINNVAVSNNYLLNTDQRNEIVIETEVNGNALTPGQYILEVDYYNTLVECGGSASKIITITDKTVIAPVSSFCVEERVLVETTSTSSATNWEIYFGNNPVINFSGTALTLPFQTAGFYTVIAQIDGKCKSEPVQLEIIDKPNNPINSIVEVVGEDSLVANPQVCPGIPVQLKYENTAIDSYIEWRIVAANDGYIEGNTTGEVVTAIFTDISNSPNNNSYRVQLRRVSRDPAACTSDWTDKYLLPKTISNTIEASDPLSPNQNIFCTSSSAAFEATYLEGEYYTWTIVPDNLGSVVSGQGTPNVVVEWNEIPNGYVQNASDGLRVSVRECGIDFDADEYAITLTDDPNLRFINLPAEVCANNEFELSFTSDIAFAISDLPSIRLILDGAVQNKSPVFDSNTNTFTYSNIGFRPRNNDFTATIRVVLDDPTGCNTGVIEDTILVRANPQIDIDVINGSSNPSSSPWSTTFEAIVQGNPQGYFYTWYNELGTVIASGVNVSTATVTNVNGFGRYFVDVTSPNGCVASDGTIIFEDNTLILPCSGPDSVLTNVAWNSCDQITASITSNHPNISQYEWFITSIDPNNGATIDNSSTINTGVFNIEGVGNYRVSYDVLYTNGCVDRKTEMVTVGYQAALDINPTCSGNNSYDVELLNSSAYLLAYQPTSAVYTGRNLSTGGTTFPITGNLTSANLSNLTPGIYEFSMTIDGPNGPPCTVVEVIDLTLPDASFTIMDTCTENTLTLSPTVAQRDGYTYEWSFNGTTNENYEVDVILPQLMDTEISLTVTDPYGCMTTTFPVETINVTAATFIGTLEGDGSYCHTDTIELFYDDNDPFNTIPDPVSMQWFASGGDVLDGSGNVQPLATTTVADPIFTPTISGSYYARAYDGNGCFVELSPAVQVIIEQPYFATIPDQGQICLNDDYFIEASIDASLDNVEYRWTRRISGTPNAVEIKPWGNTSPVGVLVNESVAGGHSYTLEVRSSNSTNTCVTSVTKVIYLLNPPETTIAVNYNCNPNDPYEVQLTATNPGIYVDNFLWSDGQMGDTITVNRGGAFQVTSISTYYNCPIIANVEVRKHPEEYIWVFPTGCVEQCPEDLTSSIIGPLPSFINWAWVNEPLGDISGSGSSVTDYNMSSAAGAANSQVQLYLESLGGCSIESLPLFITTDGDFCVDTSERSSEEFRSLKIIPNPTQGATTIAWDGEDIFSTDLYIKIYSLDGILLINKKVHNQWDQVSFDASSLKTGAYLVRLEDQDQVYLTGQLLKK